jgi:SAM-dependent methyltransferase
MLRRSFVALFPALACSLQYEEGKGDVPFVPTPERTVQDMLDLAGVEDSDVVYDLGCGDGRIVVTAARKYGARGVGIDIDPERIREANERAKTEGVTDRVKFLEADLFLADISPATVVTLYLLTTVNARLRPKLAADLKPGTRIVSHQFDLEGWKPAKKIVKNSRLLYLWIVPEKR